MRSFCVAPHHTPGANATHAAAHLHSAGSKDAYFKTRACALFDLHDRKYDELPRSLIMNSARSHRAHKRAAAFASSLSVGLSHTPAPYTSTPETSRREELNYCRGANVAQRILALEKRGCATLSEMISAVATAVDFVML
jgi:hypothetical protein